MANTKDNKLKGFASSDFRKNSEDGVTEIKEDEVNGVLNPDVNLPPLVVDIKKLLETDAAGKSFVSNLVSTDRKKVFDGITGIIKDDMSMKGTSLKNKNDIRKFFTKECVGLGKGKKGGKSIGKGTSGYSILAMMLALACSGVKDIISGIKEAFPDSISEEAINNVIPRLLEVHNGEDVTDLIKDLAKDGITNTLNANLLDAKGQLLNLYNKDRDKTNRNDEDGKPKIDLLTEALDKFTDGLWERGEEAIADVDISNLTKGLFGSDSVAKVASKPPDSSLDTNVVSEPLDVHETVSLFDPQQTNRRRDAKDLSPKTPHPGVAKRPQENIVVFGPRPLESGVNDETGLPSNFSCSSSIDPIVRGTESTNLGPIFSNIIDGEGEALTMVSEAEYSLGKVNETAICVSDEIIATKNNKYRPVPKSKS